MTNSENAKVFIDTNRVISAISPLLFSGFAEHMGRCIMRGFTTQRRLTLMKTGCGQMYWRRCVRLTTVPCAIPAATS